MVAGDSGFAILGARVFDGTAVINAGAVVVRGDRISTVGSLTAADEDLPSVSGAGATLLPGLIDCHTHTPGEMAWARKHLRQALAAGVTTQLCLGSGPPRSIVAIKAAADSDMGLAGLRSSGECATAPGGHPTQWGGDAYPTIATAEEAIAFVQSRAADGMDYIKIVLEDWVGRACPTLSPALTEALVDAAHDHGLRTVAHVSKRCFAEQALEAGIDGFAHQFSDIDLDPTLAARIAAAGVFTIMTLAVHHVVDTPGLAANPHLADYMEPTSRERLAGQVVEHLGSVARAGDEPKPPNPSAERILRAVSQLHAAGATILAGTDAPGIGATGASLHLELELLVRGGLTPIEALTAATAGPADTFGNVADRGRIAPGKIADLLLVDGDPTTNILDTRRIRSIWRHGVLFDRDAYRDEVSKPAWR